MIVTYTNGSYQVSQYPDGTRIFSDPIGKFDSEFPDNLDVKITDYCDIGCKFCYEDSGIHGKHCNSDILLEKLSKLPEGIEVTLGGGNPLSHPEIDKIIKGISLQGKFVSMTVNEKSFEKSKIPIGLRALGISPIPGIDKEVFQDPDDLNIIVVYHFIVGIHPLEQIEKYLKAGKRVLILGYKSIGRGKNNIPPRLEEWGKGLKRLKFRLTEGGEFPEARMSLDNLAIRQINFRASFSTSEWDLFYLGEDGTCSMYIDAVEGTYSESSTVSKVSRCSWNGLEIIDYFKNAKTNI